MELLNKRQTQDLINSIDRTRIPMSITPSMVASVLNYLLNSVPLLAVEVERLHILTADEAVDIVEKEFSSPLNLNGYE